MEQIIQLDSVRNAILRKQEEFKRQQEKLLADLQTIDRIAREYGSLEDDDVAPKNNAMEVPTAPLGFVASSLPSDEEILENHQTTLVQAAIDALAKRPNEKLWTSNKAYQAIKEDGFSFTREEKFATSSVSVVLSKLVQRGMLQIVRQKVGRMGAIYKVSANEEVKE